MTEPVLFNSFSLNKVRFYVKASYIILKNSLLLPCNNLCLYVNTDKPRPGSFVEAYSCSDAVSAANNNELFIHTGSNAIVHSNSKHCIGYNNTKDLVLQSCNHNNTPFKIQFNNDYTIYFEGLPKDCWYIDDTSRLSPNYIDKDTSIKVTSQADKQSYKKENLRSK
jgi:hypothetical protein